jgi:hypothetical protein
MNQIVELVIFERAPRGKIAAVFVYVETGPVTIEPEAGEFTILRAEFPYLSMKEIQVV